MGPDRMFGMTPWVRRLLVANLLVFLLQKTVFLSPRFVAFFGFAPIDAFERPWTFLTYLFLHAGLLHLAFNLLALFVFGPPVEERMGGRTFIGYYLLCGLGGATLSYVLMQVVPVSVVLGASGAIYGVALAFAWYWPRERIMVFPLPEPIPVKWLVIFLVAFSLILAKLGASDGTAHLAHLGGFAAGFLFLKGQDLRLAQAERRVRRAAEPSVVVHPAARAVQVSGGREPRGGKPRTTARRNPPDATRAEIDRVLDKISASGMGSLTPAERKFLTELSRQMRDQD